MNRYEYQTIQQFVAAKNAQELHEAEALMAAVDSSAHVAAGEWRSIKSAPKDGTKVDLWIHIYPSPRSMGWSDSFRVIDSWYEDGKWVHYDHGVRSELYDGYVTHWMPISPPPVAPVFTAAWSSVPRDPRDTGNPAASPAVPSDSE